MQEIGQLSAVGDLTATYEKIDNLRSRIQSLPSDIQSNLLDALQSAELPVDQMITKI